VSGLRCAPPLADFPSRRPLGDFKIVRENMISGFVSLDGGNGTNRLRHSNNQFGGFAANRFS
jgi:hypothetical protein